MSRIRHYLIRYIKPAVYFFVFAIPAELVAQAENNDGSPPAPLVISVPGFIIPGLTVPQQLHFGNLEQIMRDKGIAYKCIVYNSTEHPLPETARLLAGKYSIAVTRVIPDIIQSIEEENARRKKTGIKNVKDVVLMPYSQGTVITLQFYNNLLHYKWQLEDYQIQFGTEFNALLADPIMNELILAGDMFSAIDNVKNQREHLFIRDNDLNAIYSKAHTELHRRFNRLYGYILKPNSIYPGVTSFEPPETYKYPKKYPKLNAYFTSIKNNRNEQTKLIDFFVAHSTYYKIKDIEFRLFCIAGSIFGSPEANVGYDILYRFPPTQSLVKGIKQIKDTRLGNSHHIKGLVKMFESKWEGKYPFDDKNIMFIVGANEEDGDGLVTQPCAHLSQHRFVSCDLAKYAGEKSKVITLNKNELPKLRVVPLNVRHFPVKTFFGLGPTLPGAAYITANHPTLDYLMAFINKDYPRIEYLEKKNPVKLQQFMISFYIGKVGIGKTTSDTPLFEPGSPQLQKIIKELAVNIDIIALPNDFILQGTFFNADNFTYVFLGAYNDNVDTSAEQKLVFKITSRMYPASVFCVPVKAGCATFIRILDSRKETQSRT